MTLPREGSPDITIPYVTVTALYEGTAPEEMENLITIPMEKKLTDVDHIKEMRSTSSENVSTIIIEFEAGRDIDLAKQQVKDKIDLAKPDLPEDLDEPIVDSFNFSSDAPVFIFSLSGKTDLERLKKIGEDLEDQIELISGVRDVTLSGIREREIRIEIDLPRMIAYHIPLSIVMDRIAKENATMSAGNIEMAGDKFQIRIPGEFELVNDMEDILLTERNGKQIYVRDIATVSDTFKDLETITRVNTKPAVSINITKRVGVNSVRMINNVKDILDTFQLPPDIDLTIILDESDYIDSMIKELENNIFTGFLLVVIVLLLFLGGRNSVFVGLAIPFSMLLAFTVMGLKGSTLNMIVLFSLVLAVGMLVDNAIVIVENIYRNRTLGLSKKEAARRGAGEVAWPVITSTLTTLAAFSPLLFWPDIMGQFMSYLPRTLIIVLSASLFVAIVINPAICSAFIKARPRDRKEKEHPFIEGYERILRGALKHRVVVLLIGFAFLILSFLVYGFFGKGVELFPDVEPRNATVQVKFPQGTSIERTDNAMKQIEKKLKKYNDIEFYLTTVGSGGMGVLGGGSSGTHIGNIFIEFVDMHDREDNSFDLIRKMREDIGTMAGAELKVEKQEEGPPTGAPISIELSGDDFDTLNELSQDIRSRIETTPGLVDLQDDMEEALPELQFHVNRKRAALLGLDTRTIGTFLRMAIYGLEASKFRADEEEYDITLRLPETQRNSEEVLEQIFIPVPGGGTVPLTSLGEVVYTGGRGAITRKDQKRMITITGNDQERGVDEILKDVQVSLEELTLPQGYTLEYTGDNEEMQKSGQFLMKAFALAIGLIFIILVIQFNSILMPFIIMFSVVLSLIGVTWGLLLCGMRFGIIMTGVGVISLAGIVVNNAIVLIDCIIQRRREGLDATEAVVEAGKMRLRPVLLTATTTILGLIPMAIGYSLEIHHLPPRITSGAESSAWWAPMAVAVIFGLALATLLTLILVPTMYSLADSLSRAVRQLAGTEAEE